MSEYLLKLHTQIAIGLALFAFGCAQPGPEIDSEFPPAAIPEDLVVVDTGKADSAGFSADHLVEDRVFTDSEYLSEEEIQDFFENNPYGNRSYLAGYKESGMSAAEIIAAAGAEFRINPLILLTKIQVETSLVFATSTPSSHKMLRATGCGCHDGVGLCAQSVEGFRLQIRCAAQAFRSYLTDLEGGGATISGWRVGKSKYAQDDILVVPANAATAALYTYTPWVLPYEGGNWLFRNVLLKFSHHVLKGKPNHRWIGSSCTNDSSCAYEGGVCAVEDGAEVGYCTQSCEQYCPDTEQVNTAQTFCVDIGLGPALHEQGSCLSKCDQSVHGSITGCAEGFQCVASYRYGDSSASAEVCWPESP